MPQCDNDIELFRQLRKQLQPLLASDKNQLLERIESKVSGAGSLPGPAFIKKKKLTHKDRVAKYL